MCPEFWVHIKLRFNDIGFVLQASNLVPFLTAKQQLEIVDRIINKQFKINIRCLKNWELNI